MDKIALRGSSRGEIEVPTDLLASLLIEQASAPSAGKRRPDRLTVKVYFVMAVTTLLTFATLTTAYQLLFPSQAFA